MPSYAIHYFPTRGLAEVSRQLFALSGTPYTDNRIAHEDFPKYKDSMPFGKAPVLEIDGKKLPQSLAIARYLANQFGYAGKTPFEAAWVDALADQAKDFQTEFQPYMAVATGRVPGDKDKLLKEVGQPALERFFGILEKQLKDTGSGYLVGNSLTWIDLVIADFGETLEGFAPNAYSAYPKLTEHRKKVQNTPKLKEWIARRPKTPF